MRALPADRVDIKCQAPHASGVCSLVDVRTGQAAAPVFDKMSEDHDGVIFCKVGIGA